MKTITVSLILTSSCLLPQVWAKGPDGGDRPSGGDRQRPSAGAWKEADSNGDGVISREEFDQLPRLKKLKQEQRDRLFKRLDKDGDGQMGKDDMHKIRDRHGDRDPKQRIWELDKDKSGGVSFEEFQKGRMFQRLDAERQQAIFKRLDEDGDGFVTPKDKPERPERRPGGGEQRPKKMPPGAFMEKMDANKDGSVTFDEFQKMELRGAKTLEEKKRRFNRIDKNQDGKLTKDDFARMRDRKRPDDREAPQDRPQRKPESNIE